MLTDLDKFADNLYANSEEKQHYVLNGKRSKQEKIAEFVVEVDYFGAVSLAGCPGGCNFGNRNKVAGFNTISG